MAIIEVVKYNGGPDVFAWKHPSEELGTWTQLIVNESQEVLLYKGGKALDIFTAGRYTLETFNIPILNNIINLPFGGRSPFTAEVWYVNKINSLDIKWGTPTPIQLQDPRYKVFVPVRSFGQFGIQIVDSRKFLIKLVGTLPLFDKETLLRYFRGVYLTKVKDSISSYLIKKQISVLEINAYIDELSEHIKDRILPTFEEYGIKLINFYINDINVPEDDSAVKKLKDALSKRAEMDIVGYNYIQERSFDTLEGAASNPGSNQSSLMGAGIGISMGMGIGGAFGQQMSGISQNVNTKKTKICTKCNAELDEDKRFCSACGFDTNEISIVNTQQESITCSKCGSKFSGNVKFCAECGESLVKKCIGCGIKIDGNPKFCPECGIKL